MNAECSRKPDNIDMCVCVCVCGCVCTVVATEY
jgi:hypothetical protein